MKPGRTLLVAAAVALAAAVAVAGEAKGPAPTTLKALDKIGTWDGKTVSAELEGPYEDPLQATVRFGQKSYWLAPWRAWMDTWPAARFLRMPGVNFNVHELGEFEPVATILAEAGITGARVEVGWGSFRYEDPAQLADAERLRQKLATLKRHGIRPLMLLNANSGWPCPIRSWRVRLIKDAPEGAREIAIDKTDAVRPHYTGLRGQDYQTAFPLIVKADAATGRCELSAPLRKAIKAGEIELNLLKYPPLSGEFQVGAVAGEVRAQTTVVIAKKAAPRPTPVPPLPKEIKGLRWSGEVPAQKWMNFYTKVLAKFATGSGLKLTVNVEVSPEGGVSPERANETKAALRELGLDDEVKAVWTGACLARMNLRSVWAARESAASGRTDARLYLEAVEAFRRAVVLDRSDPDIWFGLGVCLSELGRHDEALEALEEGALTDLLVSPRAPAFPGPCACLVPGQPPQERSVRDDCDKVFGGGPHTFAQFQEAAALRWGHGHPFRRLCAEDLVLGLQVPDLPGQL